MHPFGKRVAVAAQVRELFLDQGLGLIELIHRRHHREHDAQLALGGGIEQRADLRAQEPGPVQPEADRAPTKCGILFFLLEAHVGQHLVTADVERAKSDLAILGCVEDLTIKPQLFGGTRQLGRDHEL